MYSLREHDYGYSFPNFEYLFEHCPHLKTYLNIFFQANGRLQTATEFQDSFKEWQTQHDFTTFTIHEKCASAESERPLEEDEDENEEPRWSLHFYSTLHCWHDNYSKCDR